MHCSFGIKKWPKLLGSVTRYDVTTRCDKLALTYKTVVDQLPIGLMCYFVPQNPPLSSCLFILTQNAIIFAKIFQRRVPKIGLKIVRIFCVTLSLCRPYIDHVDCNNELLIRKIKKIKKPIHGFPQEPMGTNVNIGSTQHVFVFYISNVYIYFVYIRVIVLMGLYSDF